jgi:exopolysaccharide biosynthesis polyprenyl glycosylphosphotransferase
LQLSNDGSRAQVKRRAYERPALRPLDRQSWRRLMMVTALSDVVALGTALFFATGTRFGRATINSNNAYGRGVWMWLILWWASLVIAGMYERNRIENRVEELRATFNGVSLGAALAIAGAFFVHFQVSRIWVGMAWALGLVFVILGRAAIRFVVGRLRTRGRLRRRAIVVGADAAGRDLAQAAAKATWEGVDIVGFVAVDDVSARGEDVIGTLSDLREIVVGSFATEVLVGPTATGEGKLSEIVGALDGLTVELRVAPGLEGFFASRLQLHPLGDRALVGVERVELKPAAKLFKRVFDLALGIPLTLLFLPLILLTAIAIRIDSKGWPFFRQTRVGLGGRHFKMIKLRSMVANAEALVTELETQNEVEAVLFKMKRDPRITRVGRVIRATSIDELPQLFNVLLGNMSLVGPRPLPLRDVIPEGSPLQRRILVKPGMTGMWQVNGRHELSYEDFVKQDLLYVQNWSVALDMLILARTIPAILNQRGSY